MSNVDDVFKDSLAVINERYNTELVTQEIITNINNNLLVERKGVLTDSPDSVNYLIISSLVDFMQNNFVNKLPESLSLIYNSFLPSNQFAFVSCSKQSIIENLRALTFVENANVYNTDIAGELYIVIKLVDDHTLTDNDRGDIALTIYNNISAGSLNFTTGTDDTQNVELVEGGGSAVIGWDYVVPRYFDITIRYWRRAEEVQFLNLIAEIEKAFDNIKNDKYNVVIGKDLYYQDLTALKYLVSGISEVEIELQEIDENGDNVGNLVTAADIITIGDKKGAIVDIAPKEYVQFRNVLLVEGTYE